MVYIKKILVLLIAFFVGCVFVAYKPDFGEGIKNTFSKISTYTEESYEKVENKLFKSTREESQIIEDVRK